MKFKIGKIYKLKERPFHSPILYLENGCVTIDTRNVPDQIFVVDSLKCVDRCQAVYCNRRVLKVIGFKHPICSHSAEPMYEEVK